MKELLLPRFIAILFIKMPKIHTMTPPTRPSITLPQGQVRGVRIDQPLPQPIDAFLLVPYARLPTGDRRFRPLVKVPDSKHITEASQYGYAAPGKALLSGGLDLEQSEDCLTVNVFRPAGIEGKVPVAIYLHGGAFNRGAAAMHDTASMVGWSEAPFVAVSFGYRIGALGFLPSSVSKEEGILNLGLRDQVHLFEWVSDNIQRFGGDPGNVTLIGLSAGAHSVSVFVESFFTTMFCKIFRWSFCPDFVNRSAIIF